MKIWPMKHKKMARAAFRSWPADVFKWYAFHRWYRRFRSVK